MAVQNQREDEIREQEAAERGHAMLHAQGRIGSFSQSASQLANQLSNSIDDGQYGQPSPFKPVAPKKSFTPVQSEKTASLIAQAILHQQQKAAGIEEEPAAPEVANSVRFEPMQSLSQPQEKPFVSKDELIEGNNMKISEQDQVASHNAVMATLNKIKGVK